MNISVIHANEKDSLPEVVAAHQARAILERRDARRWASRLIDELMLIEAAPYARTCPLCLDAENILTMYTSHGEADDCVRYDPALKCWELGFVADAAFVPPDGRYTGSKVAVVVTFSIFCDWVEEDQVRFRFYGRNGDEFTSDGESGSLLSFWKSIIQSLKANACTDVWRTAAVQKEGVVIQASKTVEEIVGKPHEGALLVKTEHGGVAVSAIQEYHMLGDTLHIEAAFSNGTSIRRYDLKGELARRALAVLNRASS